MSSLRAREERVGPALKTLAALGDPRAVPALRWVLGREVLPQDIGFVLASMGRGAAEFIPAMVRWLRTLPVVRGWDTSREGLILALGRLGPAAAPAVSDLVMLLGNERIASSAARTLGQIGPLAAPAIPTLRDLLDHSNASIGIAAARALYSITGDAASTLPTLKRHLVDRSKNKSTPQIALPNSDLPPWHVRHSCGLCSPIRWPLCGCGPPQHYGQ